MYTKQFTLRTLPGPGRRALAASNSKSRHIFSRFTRTDAARPPTTPVLIAVQSFCTQTSCPGSPPCSHEPAPQPPNYVAARRGHRGTGTRSHLPRHGRGQRPAATASAVDVIRAERIRPFGGKASSIRYTCFISQVCKMMETSKRSCRRVQASWQRVCNVQASLQALHPSDSTTTS